MPVIDISTQVNSVIALLPEEEHVDAVRLAGALLMLHRHFYSFAAAVALIDHTDSLRRTTKPGGDEAALLDDWNHIACRDAVMTLYQFGEVLASLRRTRPTVSLRARVDGRRIRAAAESFNSQFPTIRQARNAVGHVAEMTTSMDAHERHARDGMIYFGGLKGRAYTITNEKAHHTITLTPETRETLRKILHEVHNSHAWLGVEAPDLPKS